MKLLLGIPSAGSPVAPFLESVAQLRLPPSVTVLERVLMTGNFVPAQRDLIVERALERNADVLIMCDDDMVLSPNALVDLCALLEADARNALAGALYYSRDSFRPMVVDRWDENDTRTAVIPAFDREPVPVDGVGFGCVALRVSALRELMPRISRPTCSSNAAPAGCAYATRTISSARAFGKLGIACFSTPACAAVTTIASRAPLRPRPGSRRKLRDGNAWPRWLTATPVLVEARPAPTEHDRIARSRERRLRDCSLADFAEKRRLIAAFSGNRTRVGLPTRNKLQAPADLIVESLESLELPLPVL